MLTLSISGRFDTADILLYVYYIYQIAKINSVNYILSLFLI